MVFQKYPHTVIFYSDDDEQHREINLLTRSARVRVHMHLATTGSVNEHAGLYCCTLPTGIHPYPAVLVFSFFFQCNTGYLLYKNRVYLLKKTGIHP